MFYLNESPPITMFIDFWSRRIFWNVGNTVRSATFEGKKFVEFHARGQHYSWSKVMDIDIHGDDLYYSDNINPEMQKVNKSGDNPAGAAHVYHYVRAIRTYNGKG